MRRAIARNPRTGQIYVASYAAGTVTIFDKGQVTATIEVPSHPQALALDADKSLLYVASPQQNAVVVINVQTHRVLKTMTTTGHPYALVVNPANHAVYTGDMGATPYTALVKP